LPPTIDRSWCGVLTAHCEQGRETTPVGTLPRTGIGGTAPSDTGGVNPRLFSASPQANDRGQTRLPPRPPKDDGRAESTLAQRIHSSGRVGKFSEPIQQSASRQISCRRRPEAAFAALSPCSCEHHATAAPRRADRSLTASRTVARQASRYTRRRVEISLNLGDTSYHTRQSQHATG
jgi:hypothetical protein